MQLKPTPGFSVPPAGRLQCHEVVVKMGCFFVDNYGRPLYLASPDIHRI